MSDEDFFLNWLSSSSFFAPSVHAIQWDFWVLLCCVIFYYFSFSFFPSITNAKPLFFVLLFILLFRLLSVCKKLSVNKFVDLVEPFKIIKFLCNIEEHVLFILLWDYWNFTLPLTPVVLTLYTANKKKESGLLNEDWCQ